MVQGLTSSSDVELVTSSDLYDIGDTIVFSGELAFSFGELATTTAIHLVLSGPQTISTNIPLLEGNHNLSNSAGVQAQLLVEVSFSDVSETGMGTNVFKGLTEGAKILIEAQWTPDQQIGSAGDYSANLSADVEGAGGPLTSEQVHFAIVAPTAPAASSGSSGGAGIRLPTKTPTRTARPTWTSTATPAATATETAGSTGEPIVALTATPTVSPTESPSPSPSPSPSATPVSTSTPSPTATSLPTATATASPTKVPTPTPTPLVLDSILAIGDTPEPALELAIFEESSDGKEEPIPGSRAGVIALIVLGLAIGSVLVAVVGIPLLRN